VDDWMLQPKPVLPLDKVELGFETPGRLCCQQTFCRWLLVLSAVKYHVHFVFVNDIKIFQTFARKRHCSV